MKWLFLLFAVYFLLLPCVPCTDTDECRGEIAAAIIAPVDHNGHPHSEDACNPFCSCACCGQICYSMFPTTRETLPLSWKSRQQPHPYTNAALPSDYWGNIWQPPKCS